MVREAAAAATLRVNWRREMPRGFDMTIPLQSPTDALSGPGHDPAVGPQANVA
jgi:hypothetical protein